MLSLCGTSGTTLHLHRALKYHPAQPSPAQPSRRLQPPSPADPSCGCTQRHTLLGESHAASALRGACPAPPRPAEARRPAIPCHHLNHHAPPTHSANTTQPRHSNHTPTRYLQAVTPPARPPALPLPPPHTAGRRHGRQRRRHSLRAAVLQPAGGGAAGGAGATGGGAAGAGLAQVQKGGGAVGAVLLRKWRRVMQLYCIKGAWRFEAPPPRTAATN
jgi:hypothetical protein